ncbi:MAG TPA: IS701 family transposase [Methylomirabilota bacterium]|nr:IS701 family transposase [Methylomirabilota bacterium]
MTEPSARALLRRFGQFADQFAGCFTRRPQREAASQYIEALFNDSERKSMQAMHGRLSDPVSYQALQHFITDSPWEAARLWKRLHAQIPVRGGILALDDTSFPKQGKHSVGVKRQYCGALGKVANCQVAVSTVLVRDALAWPLSFELYLPREWFTDATRRTKTRIPAGVRFREKWRIALAHIRQVRKAGFHLTAVVADADYGSTAAFRGGLERLGLRYGVAIRWFLVMWTPGARRTQTAAEIAAAIPDPDWQRVSWADGTKGPLAARFTAIRVRPAKSRGERWLLCERSLIDDERKYYLLNLDATASLRDLVTLARSRWPIEQQYRELKDELGIDHFEGRSYRGWTHHTVLTAIAFTFLQLERRRADDEPRPTLPHVRSWVREIMAVLYVIGNRKLLNLLVSFQRNPPLRR